jgi:hypothetical protein
MNRLNAVARATALLLPPWLAGCSLLPTTRHLPVPKAPAITQTVSADELVRQLNTQWEELKTLTATVEIEATETKSAEGIEKDFPSCRGFIVKSKPDMLRVAGTYFGVKIFDMASDGQKFTLVMPTKNMAIQGSSTVTERSKNPLENLRPDFFLDALTIRGLDSDDEFMVAGDSETIEDTQKKHLFIEPEYILSVMKHKSGNQNLPVRVVTIHRDDMLPYGQDIYDAEGNIQTQIVYSNYTEYNGGKYPSRVVIKRPQEGIQLILTVYRVEKNVSLTGNQFQVNIPADAKVRTLH